MTLKYYPDTDSLYIELSSRPSADSREISGEVVIDYEADGSISSMELESIWHEENNRKGSALFAGERWPKTVWQGTCRLVHSAKRP